MGKLGFLRSVERDVLRRIVQPVRRGFQKSVLSWRSPAALTFYETVIKDGYISNDLIDIVSGHNMLYIANPKAACTRIRATLAFFLGHDVITNWSPERNWSVHNRSNSGLIAPRHNISEFYSVATNPAALRFSFVRNPYDRMVSCWLDQYRGKPLTPGGDIYIDTYLDHRKDASAALPAGSSETLSFPQFVEFALATRGIARPTVGMHWHPQTKILHVPGMELNFIGRIENFEADFSRVLDFMGASREIRAKLVEPFHYSKRRPVGEYLNTELAAKIYAAYEEDFDRFGYPRAIPA